MMCEPVSFQIFSTCPFVSVTFFNETKLANSPVNQPHIVITGKRANRNFSLSDNRSEPISSQHLIKWIGTHKHCHTHTHWMIECLLTLVLVDTDTLNMICDYKQWQNGYYYRLGGGCGNVTGDDHHGSGGAGGSGGGGVCTVNNRSCYQHTMT